jgi:hypothetical protein
LLPVLPEPPVPPVPPAVWDVLDIPLQAERANVDRRVPRKA